MMADRPSAGIDGKFPPRGAEPGGLLEAGQADGGGHWRAARRREHTAPVIGRRTLRRVVAFLATAAIVTAQSAAAAHACTRTGAPVDEEAAGAVCPEHGGRADGAPAEGGNANLCEVHCQDATAPVAVVPACAPAPEGAIVVPEPLATAAGVPAAEPDAKGAPPPARSRYCRLQL